MLRDMSTSGDQVRHDAFIDIEIAFVFTEITNIVTFCQYAPNFRTKSERVWQQLEDDIPIGRTIAMPAKCGEAHGVRGIVGEIETAFQRKVGLLRILQSPQARA